MRCGEFDGFKCRKRRATPIDLGSSPRNKIIPAAKNEAASIHGQPHFRAVNRYPANPLLKIHVRG